MLELQIRTKWMVWGGIALMASLGFLWADDTEWSRAEQPRAWAFPRDHGAHPDFKTEWWYFTGNLKETGTERRFAFELALFRQGVQFLPVQKRSKWAVRDLFMGNFAISDIAESVFYPYESLRRGEIGGHASEGGMDTAVGNWGVKAEGTSETYHVWADAEGQAIDLKMTPLKPLIFEGDKGLSLKGALPGEASYYYSYPRLKTEGTVVVNGVKHSITGTSWFDHEFSTSSLGRNQVGWDWFCVQLKNGEELMLYVMRDTEGVIDPQSQGTWVKADGTTQRILPGEFQEEVLGTWKSPNNGANYSCGWKIHLSKLNILLTVQPTMYGQELSFGGLNNAYWEGACDIKGTENGAAVEGVGYTELTGYAQALGKELR